MQSFGNAVIAYPKTPVPEHTVTSLKNNEDLNWEELAFVGSGTSKWLGWRTGGKKKQEQKQEEGTCPSVREVVCIKIADLGGVGACRVTSPLDASLFT